MKPLHLSDRALFAAALAFFAATALAEPPTLISLIQEDKVRSSEQILPIPPEATEEMKAEFQAVIAESKANDVSVTEQSAILYHGLMLTQDEDYEAAIPFLEEALRRDPSMQPGWEGLGWAYVKTDQLEKATKLWKYFQRLMPEHALPYTLLAQSAILHQDWEEADANFRKSLEINPDQYDIEFWFAQNLMRIGKADEADAVFVKLIEQDPGRLDVQLNRAALLTQRLNYDEAVDIYRHVNDELPGNPKFMYEQAVLELRVGELETADKLCVEILEIDPSHSGAMNLRADIAEIDGQLDIAPLQAVIDETEDETAKAALNMRLATRCHLINQRSPGSFSESFILGLMASAISNDANNVGFKVLYAERLLQAEHYAHAHSIAVDVLENHNRHNSRAKMILYEIALHDLRFGDARQILADRYVNQDASDPMAYYYRARIDVKQGNYAEALKELDKMEAAASEGCVLTLLYHDLTESDWTPVTSVRRLHEHITALQREGWQLVSPTDIPDLVGLKPGESRPTADVEEDPPLTARLVDYFRWSLTGTRKFKKRGSGTDEITKPLKYFAITFDDDLRSSLVLGTDVARDVGVPFGIFTPTEPVKEYTPSRAGWEELREAAASGNWIVGSELYASYLKKPVDPEGKDVRNSLVNRLWIEKKNRKESMNEWDRRMRHEFRESRRILRKELGDDDSEIAMVAYPYGDIGQEEACNLTALRAPAMSILSESARSYQLGFAKSETGYTVSGDNLLCARRYQPAWTDEGADLVRHAYEYHPVFVARKLRAEIAMLMNRPNLATAMLDVLRRDGYPEELCNEIETELHAHFQNKPNRELKTLVTEGAEAETKKVERDAQFVDENGDAITDPELIAAAREAGLDKEEIEQKTWETDGDVQEGSVDPWIALQDPFVGVEFSHTKANDQIEILRLGARAGLNLNNNTTFSGEYFQSDLEQTVRPHWNAQVTTNVPYAESIYKFKAEVEEWRLQLTHRFESGAVLSASVGRCAKRQLSRQLEDRYYTNLQDHLNEHKFHLDGDDECTLITVGASFNPGDNLYLNFFYDRGFVSSAVKNIVYDSAAANAEWKPEDAWFIKAHGQYWTYEDDNAMFNASFDSLWETSRELGIWMGFTYQVVTTSEPSDFYWTPYWDQRLMGVFSYQQVRDGYNLSLKIMAGMQGEKGREDRAYEQPVFEEKEVTEVVDGVQTTHTVVQEKMQFVIAEDKDTGWHRSWAISGKYEKQLGKYLNLTLEGEVLAMRQYIDHFLLIYLKAQF